MFVGSKFCGHCGARAVQINAEEDAHLGICPRCKIALGRVEIGETGLRECGRCDGMWAGVETFENVCADREKQSAVLGYIGEKPKVEEGRPRISYVPCPDCGQLMNRSNFAHSSGVIIDICKQHGVWFDAEELPKIIDFIRKGGMEMARNKERMELEAERDRLRSERNRLALEDHGIGIIGTWESDETVGIRNIVQKLFE